jgi:glutathione peroxidase-family protein
MPKIKKDKLKKKEILDKFILIPKSQKRDFYCREFKLLNLLIERYSEDFIKVLTFPKKYDSMAIILSDGFKKTLDLKFKAFSYKTNDSNYESIPLFENKSGEDSTVKPRLKTIREFLNG